MVHLDLNDEMNSELRKCGGARRPSKSRLSSNPGYAFVPVVMPPVFGRVVDLSMVERGSIERRYRGSMLGSYTKPPYI